MPTLRQSPPSTRPATRPTGVDPTPRRRRACGGRRRWRRRRGPGADGTGPSAGPPSDPLEQPGARRGVLAGFQAVELEPADPRRVITSATSRAGPAASLATATGRHCSTSSANRSGSQPTPARWSATSRCATPSSVPPGGHDRRVRAVHRHVERQRHAADAGQVCGRFGGGPPRRERDDPRHRRYPPVAVGPGELVRAEHVQRGLHRLVADRPPVGGMVDCGHELGSHGSRSSGHAHSK